jgi:hypothetical protein
MTTRVDSDDRHGKPVVILDPDGGSPLIIMMPKWVRRIANALLGEAARATPKGKPS